MAGARGEQARVELLPVGEAACRRCGAVWPYYSTSCTFARTRLCFWCSFSGCPAVGVGGYHSRHYDPEEGGRCEWCGASPPEPLLVQGVDIAPFVRPDVLAEVRRYVWSYCIDYALLETGSPEDPAEQPAWVRYQRKLYAMVCLNFPEGEIEALWRLGLTMWPHLCKGGR